MVNLLQMIILKPLKFNKFSKLFKKTHFKMEKLPFQKLNSEKILYLKKPFQTFQKTQKKRLNFTILQNRKIT